MRKLAATENRQKNHKWSTFAKFRVVQLSLQVNLAKKRQRGKQKKTLTYLPGLISNVLGRALEMYLTLV